VHVGDDLKLHVVIARVALQAACQVSVDPLCVFARVDVRTLGAVTVLRDIAAAIGARLERGALCLGEDDTLWGAEMALVLDVELDRRSLRMRRDAGPAGDRSGSDGGAVHGEGEGCEGGKVSEMHDSSLNDAGNAPTPTSTRGTAVRGISVHLLML
jgi:hypothetical protein